jgi:hypothetical protein
MGGLFLVVLVPQNLVYLGVPVRFSAWLVLGAAIVQVWVCRRKLLAWIQTFWINADLRALAVVALVTLTFHSVVPIRQGLEWYYGKGYLDQINYVLLAEFLKEQPYGTSSQEIGLRPWLLRPVGFQASAEQLGLSSGPGADINGLKKERLGQSIVTAEISVWSGTDAKSGYAATVIFFLTVLAICLYGFLRGLRIDPLLAGSGALLAALLPAVTRLSLNGFLSQVSILFVFPFFASVLQHRELRARSFTLLFGLTLAYFIAAYSEFAPIGLGTLFLGVLLVRRDKFRTKRLILMGTILLVALLNPFYLRNFMEFLGQQYQMAAHATFNNNMAPNLLTLRGWSELIFGSNTSSPIALLFDGCALLLGLLLLAGAVFLSGRDKLILVAILLPAVLIILYLATRNPPPYYPIAKITLSILPLVIGLVFVALSRFAAGNGIRSLKTLRNLLCAMIVAAAGAGSVRYYFEVLHNEGLLRFVREPHFLKVCQALEAMKNERVLVFESHPLLTAWLCYHARHNDVHFSGRFISDSSVPPLSSFANVPDLRKVDFVATRDRIVDLRAPGVSYLSLVDDLQGEDRSDGRVRYWLGQPANLRFLALGPISANLHVRLAPGPESTSFPIDYFLKDDRGSVLQGELWGQNVDVRRMNFPEGLSTLELSVKAKDSDPNAWPSYPILAELDGIELSDIDANPGK